MNEIHCPHCNGTIELTLLVKGKPWGKTRKCFMKCHALIEFRKTPIAPNGAWVDAGTEHHHRCNEHKGQP